MSYSAPILIVTESLPPIYGGADIAAYRYFKFLQHSGQSVKLLGNYNSNLEREPNLHAVRGLRFPRMLKRFGTYYFSFSVLFVQVFFFLLLRPQYKIVHAFNSSTLIIQVSVLAAGLLGRKVILECCLLGSDDPITMLHPRGSRRHLVMSGKVIKRKLYLRGDAYIAKSAYLWSLFEGTLIPKSCVFQIPYAVDTTQYHRLEKTEKKSLRETLGLPLEKHIVCFVGGINERKGVNLLTKSFLEIVKERTDVFLVLVGPTAKYNQKFVSGIQQDIAQLGQQHGRMTGQVIDTASWMKASDIYVLPTYREGFPISIIEALCSGLLVIGSSIPEINGVQIQHKENGLVFEVGSVSDLTNKLNEALNILESGDSFTTASSKVAVATFEVNGIASQYESIYQRIV